MWQYKDMALQQAYYLHSLLDRGDIASLQKELDILLNEPQKNWNTQILIYALRGGFDDLAVRLFEFVDPSNIYFGTTFTHHAVHGNCSQALSILLSKGFDDDLTAKDYNGETPIGMAVEKDHLGLLKLMHRVNPRILEVRGIDGQNLLHTAAFYGAIRCARWLIDKGLPINEPDAHGYPPLALTGMASMVHLFIENGADPTITLPDGKTILDHFEEAKKSWCKVEDLAQALKDAVAKKSATHLRQGLAHPSRTRKRRVM